MGFIHGAHRHEAILFPERLDDYIAAENPVRFLDAFVGFDHGVGHPFCFCTTQKYRAVKRARSSRA